MTPRWTGCRVASATEAARADLPLGLETVQGDDGTYREVRKLVTIGGPAESEKG
jgi:hypothetical protein